VSSCWPYTHEKFEDEVFMENSKEWDEVVERMVNLKMTRFRAINLDEQMMTIDKLAQEALKSREEIRAAEATEVPLVAPV
jgi:hypothetical protein